MAEFHSEGSSNAKLHCIVSGRVQGVGFRYAAATKAKSLALSGWVKNLPNGAVETVAEGGSEQVAGYLAWLQAGPPFARIDEVRIISHETSENKTASNNGGSRNSQSKSTKANFRIRY